MKKVNFLNNFFSKFFNKKCSHTQYEEIFSTTENKINTKNTNPLEIDDENIQSENNQNFQPQLSKQVEKIKETNNLPEYLLSEIYSQYPEYIKRQNAKVIRETLKKEIKSPPLRPLHAEVPLLPQLPQHCPKEFLREPAQGRLPQISFREVPHFPQLPPKVRRRR